MTIKFWLNGKLTEDTIAADTLLLDYLRTKRCYSVKRGCETANCGLCTVLLEDKPVLSCSTLAARVNGKHVTTLEGLQAEAEEFGAFLADQGAEQCGMQGHCNIQFVVEGDGDVYPCDFYVVDRYRLGSIAEHSFTELRESEPARRFVDESKHIDKDCRECKWYPICRGGCRRNREPFVGGLPAKNIYCDAYREFFDYAYPRLCELWRIAARG